MTILIARADLIEPPPAALTHDELIDAIALCRTVAHDDDSNVKGAALGQLRALLDRFPPTTAAAPTAETGATP